MAENPLLLNGFTSGWLQKFFDEPFDPLCVMLAMRSKLLLDAIDEMGKSYNLLRSIGYGWIDLGQIPGEEPGNPADYYPPVFDNPIIIAPPIIPSGPSQPGYVPPGPGQPGYVPPAPGPGQSGYVPPGPSNPAYWPPPAVPGTPDYGPPMPGQPGYVPPVNPLPPYVPPTPAPAPPPQPGPTPPPATPPPPGGAGGGAIGPSGAGVTGGPSGVRPARWSPQGGHGGGNSDNPSGAMSPPWGFGGIDDIGGPGRVGGAGHEGAGIDCCRDNTDPSSNVTIGYATLLMACGELQNLLVIGANPICDEADYEWLLYSEQGSLSAASGTDIFYTAPAGGVDCESPVQIGLFCNGVLVDSITIVIKSCPASVSIGFTTHQLQVDGAQTLTAVPDAPACGVTTYDWAITAGAGTLDSPTGSSVTYTAPHTNANCAGNPTITLSCGGIHKDTLKLAVNAYTANSVGQLFLATTPICAARTADTCGCTRLCPGFNCDGSSLNPTNRCYAGFEGAELLCTASYPPRVCNPSCTPVVSMKDNRTTLQKTNGCCPYQAMV